MYTMTCEVSEGQFEMASAIGYGCAMSGCVEGAVSGGRAVLTFYFEREGQAITAAAAVVELLSAGVPAVGYVDDKQDWNAKWRETMEPVEVAAGVWVSPAWLEPPAEGRSAWIKIEPKMAFGTGHHETTRLAAKALIEGGVPVAGQSVMDIGTGSGILCFVADYLGAGRSVGVEIDADCLGNLAENLRDNPPRAGGGVAFVIGTLDAIRANTDVSAGIGGVVDTCIKEDGFFDIVIMNMLSTESVPLLERIAAVTRRGSTLIWSGILIDESADVVSAAKSYGFSLSSARTESEWWCGIFVK